MKKSIVFLLILSLLFSLIPAHAADYGWTDGAIVLGSSQYKVVLPEGLYPIEPFPNELGAAMTAQYGPPDGMGITVQIMGDEPESSAAFQYQMVMEYDEATYTVKKRFTPHESATALEDWVHTLGGKDYTLYAESGSIPIKGLDLHYVFSLNNHMPNNIIQASGYFYIPAETACYCVFVSSLYQITDGDVYAQMSQLRDRSIYYIDNILQYAQGDHELEALQTRLTNVGVKLVDTAGMSDHDALLADIYNTTVESISKDHLDIITTGEMLFYPDQEQPTLLRPIVYECATGFVNGIYDIQVDSPNTETLLQSLWDIIGIMHNATIAGETTSPVFDVESFENMDIHPQQILSDSASGIDAVVFGLQDSNGRWIENAVYLLIRIPSYQNTILCLVNDQQLIDEYLASIGQTVVQLPPALQYSVVEDYQITDTIQIGPVEYNDTIEAGKVWFDEHNRLVNEMESGCQVFDTDEYQLVWSVDESATVLHPMMLVLGEGSKATEMPDSAITEDWRQMIQIVLEYAQSGQIDPMQKDVLMRLVTGEVTPEALFYGNDQSEYLVFVLTDSQTMEPIEDQFYAVLRMVSSGGTTHLTLITDQDLIKSEVQSAIAQGNSNHQSYVPGAHVPVVDSETNTPGVDSSWSANDVINYACDELLDNPVRDSYMQSVFNIVLDLQDDGVHQFSKGLYDFLTDPKGEVGEWLSSFTTDQDEKMNEQLMYEILCEMLSNVYINHDVENFDQITDPLSIIEKQGLNILEKLPGDSPELANRFDNAFLALNTIIDICQWGELTDQEVNRLIQIGNNYYTSVNLLLTIRNNYADYPFVVAACDRLIDELNYTFDNDGINKLVNDLGIDKTKEVTGKLFVDGFVDLISKKNPVIGAFLLGSDIGAVLTNQTSLLSEKEDLMVHLSFIDTVVTSRTRDYRYTDDVYPMLMLQAAVQKRGLIESKEYYNAYSSTFVGKWNTLMNGFDINRIREGIDKQYQKIDEIMFLFTNEVGYRY